MATVTVVVGLCDVWCGVVRADDPACDPALFLFLVYALFRTDFFFVVLVCC